MYSKRIVKAYSSEAEAKIKFASNMFFFEYNDDSDCPLEYETVDVPSFSYLENPNKITCNPQSEELQSSHKYEILTKTYQQK